MKTSRPVTLLKYPFKIIINSFLGLFDLEISKKHALGQQHPSSKDDSRLVAPTLVTASPEISRSSHDDLSQYFLSATEKKLHKWFHYFEIYERFFHPYRNQVGVKVLEIGVFRGGSQKMWRHYFGKTATIVGVDINPECSNLENPAESIFVRIGPQQDHNFLSSLIKEFGPFDIIIDDGSHISEHMISTFNFLYPEGLRPEGIYLVEDTHTNYWELANAKTPSMTFMEYAKTLIDRLHEPYSRYLKLNAFDFDNPAKIKEDHFSYFFKHTKGISFFDSIVVFEKCENKTLPVHQIR